MIFNVDFNPRGGSDISYEIGAREPINGNQEAYYVKFLDDTQSELVFEAFSFEVVHEYKTIFCKGKRYYIHPNGEKIKGTETEIKFQIDENSGVLNYTVYDAMQTRSNDRDYKYLLNWFLAHEAWYLEKDINGVTTQSGGDFFNTAGEGRVPIKFSFSVTDETQVSNVGQNDGSITVNIDQSESGYDLEYAISTQNFLKVSELTFQSSNVFSDLDSGFYYVYVKYTDSITSKFINSTTVSIV